MSTTKIRAFLPAVVLCLFPAFATATTNDGDRKSISIARTHSPPVIDGQIDDQEWADATLIKDFHQTVPIDGGLPTEQTIVRISYDDDFLYVSARMEDSNPEGIRATQMIQDKFFFSDDRFWFMLDSFNSKRNDYLFQVNPNGIRRDALRENNSRFIDEWSTIWMAQSSIDETGWSTEMAIPFKSISFDPDSDTWGINFGRAVMSKQEFVIWSSQDRQDWPAYGGEATGFEGMEQGLGLDIVPSISTNAHQDLVLSRTNSEFEPSLDVRYRITPSLSATFTFNTDFSTAEIDDQQIAFDRFSLFFPEKRDFFLQDAGIFEFGNINTNGRPFFSRRIGLSEDGQAIDIKMGAKQTGRLGDFSVGALAIRQVVYGAQEEKDFIVARGSMNVKEESQIGFILTDGDPTSSESNSVLGIDYLYRNSDGPWGQIVTGNFWVQQSDSSDLQGDDMAIGLQLEMPNDRVRPYFSGQEIQKNFNPALGFINRTGIRRYSSGIRYRTRPDEGYWRTVNQRLDFTQVTDMNNNVLSEYTRIRPFGLQSHGNDFWSLDFERNREVVLKDFNLFGRLNIPVGDYEFDRVRAELFSGNQRPISVVLSVQDGEFFNGDRLRKLVEIQWRQSAHFSLSARFEENDVDLPSGSFTSHLASLRTDVAFNSEWSWSTLMQYNNSAEAFGINSRLRYTPEAGQEMILVFNHNADVGIDNRLTSVANDLNLKASYTFRY
jgi:hypothetical protein